MNCRRFAEWIHLNRPGELDPGDEKKLREHLRKCPDCAGLAGRWGRWQEVVDAARERLPRPADPQELLRRVSAAVKAEPRPDEKESSWTEARHSWRIRRFHWLLPALAAAAILMVAAFALQTFSLYRRIDRLERQLAQERPPVVPSGLSIRERVALKNSLRRFQELMPASAATDLQGDGALAILRWKERLESQNALLWQWLRQTVPASEWPSLLRELQRSDVNALQRRLDALRLRINEI